MASIIKTGQVWRAFICRKDPDGNTVRTSGTFDSKQDAKDWAAATEAAIKKPKPTIRESKTVADLLNKYRDEITPQKRGIRWEWLRIGLMLKDALASVKLGDLSPQHIAAWRDNRLKTISAGSVRREWNLLSNAFTIAINEWQWLDAHPCKGVRRPPPPDARDRMFLCHEIEAILVALSWDDGILPTTVSQRVAYAMLFALETGMRCGEICALEWRDVTETVVEVRAGKTRAAIRRVPLPPYSRELLRFLYSDGAQGSVFSLTPAQVDALFRKARDRCGIDNLHWHDTRATAITRLAKRLDILDLARMIGHANLQELRTYYRESAEDIADKLVIAAPRTAAPPG